MELEFKKRTIAGEYESPFDHFRKVKVTGEIRECPVSGHVTRLLPYRIKEFFKIDLEPVIIKSKEGCPFCPEAIEAKTPRFLPDLAAGSGRIMVGEATVFPNAFPYDDYSAVAVISREHFLSLGQFRPQQFQDGFEACRVFLQMARKASGRARYAILNWNYMPIAGAGLVHPHLQAAAIEEPTLYQRALIERQKKYRLGGGDSILDDLVAKEMADRERYIARLGGWHWTMAFAPRGIYEFWAIFSGSGNLLDIKEEDLEDLASGLCSALRFLEGKGVQALNLSWYSFFSAESEGLRNIVSVLPRVHFPPFGTSDINYFDRLQRESVSFVLPETVTPEIRGFFGGH